MGAPDSTVRSRRKATGTPDRSGTDLVSVIVPAHNAEGTIGETLLSVRNQTHDNIEILVVDDGSSDRTVDIVAEHAKLDPRIRLISQTNGGVAAARNAGIALACGALIALIDSDDLWQPRKIERQLRALRAGGDEVALVYCWSALIDEDGQIFSHGEAPTYCGDVLGQLCYGNFVGNGSSALIRKAAIEEAGAFDTSLRARGGQGCEDWWLYLQIAERHHFAVVPDYLTGYRQIAGAMSGDVEQMLRSDSMVRAELADRRPEYRLQLRWGRQAYVRWLLRREFEAHRWANCLFLFRLSVDGNSRARAMVRLGRLLFRMAKHRILRSRRRGGVPFLQPESVSDLAACSSALTNEGPVRAAAS